MHYTLCETNENNPQRATAAMTVDRISYLDQCLNYFNENLHCSYPTKPPYASSTMVSHSSVSSQLTPILSSSGMTTSSENSSTAISNPFGITAVGNIKTVIPCTYNEATMGQLYITTKALCYQRIGFFGLEIERVIIPFHIVSIIEKCHDVTNGITVHTKDGKSYLFEFTIHKVDQEMNLIHQSWKESPKTLHKSAVNELFRTITTLSQEEDYHSLCVDDDDDDDVNHNEIIDNQENDVEVILNLSSVESDNCLQNDNNSNKSRILWNEYQQKIMNKSYKHEIAMVR